VRVTLVRGRFRLVGSSSSSSARGLSSAREVGSVPDVSVSEGGVPDVSVPDVSVPEVGVPDVGRPEVVTPGG
jgi:hypothetical protein